MADSLERFNGLVAPQEWAELVVLHNAVVKTLGAYKDDSSGKRLKDWQAAKMELAAAEKRLMEKYDLASADQWPSAFSEKKEAYQYLLATGWKISQSNFYKHCAEGRLSPKKGSGKYTREAVDKYAGAYLKRADTGKKVADEIETMQRRKLQLELENQEKKNAKLDHELAVAQGRYVSREQVERELGGRAAIIKSGLDHLVQTRAFTWIELVGGDQAKAQELLDAMRDEFSKLLNEYARPDTLFEVIADEG